MKVYLIAPGEELASVADESVWTINVFNKETEALTFNCLARLGLCRSVPLTEPSKFFELRNSVNLIYCESSDVKDFAKRLYDARIANCFFKEVKFKSEGNAQTHRIKNGEIK